MNDKPYLKMPRAMLRLSGLRLAMYPSPTDEPTVEIVPVQVNDSLNSARSVYILKYDRKSAEWTHVSGPDVEDGLTWDLVWTVHQSYTQSEYLIKQAGREELLPK